MAALPTDRPLRVLIGCDTLTPDVNGAARFTERLAAGLKERGVEVHLMAPAPKGVRPGVHYETIEGVELPVHRIKSQKLWGHEWVRFVFPWRAKREAKRVIDAVQPDAVHIQSHLLIGRGLAREAHARGIRLLATNHIMPENILDPKTPKVFSVPLLKWAWWDEGRVLSLAQEVTTPTRKAADFLERNTSRRGVVPVSCGIDQAKYRANFEPRSSQRIVFVGRLNQEKQIDTILRSLTHIPDDLNVHFDIVGGGDQREPLTALANELGVADRVIWHGLLPDDELRLTLTNASIFTIASIAELQSIATLEAMASGLPIIAADAMALPHLVEVGKNGYLFTPGDDRQLAARITEILRLDQPEFEAMQRSSLEMVKAHDISTTLDTFERMYRGE